MVRPAVRIDDTIIFPNGGVMKITPLERFLYKTGLKKTANYNDLWHRNNWIFYK